MWYHEKDYDIRIKVHYHYLIKVTISDTHGNGIPEADANTTAVTREI